MLIPKKDHLLLIRLSAMGDVAMVVPPLKAFKEANPDIDVTVMTRSFFRPFFRDIEGINFITPDFDGMHKGVFGIIRLWRDVNAHGITHVADLHDVLRTKMLRRLLRISGKKLAVIDKGTDEKRALTRKQNKERRQLKPSVERYLETIERLGLEVAQMKPVERIKYTVPAVIEGIVGAKQGQWIGVAPFAQHRGKIYPTKQTDELIQMLSERYQRVFVFGGGAYEKEFAEEMEARHKGVVSVVGKMKLDAELDLMSNLDMMVSMDSSAMHMSSLIGLPVVSIWGATHPYAGFYGFGQSPEGAVGLEMECRPCSVYGKKSCLYGDYRCLTQISPQMIFDRVESLLEKV